jgi:uncharacterized coiled-coil DUF342 family protein
MAAVASPVSPAPAAPAAASKPVRPDEDQFKKDLLVAEKAHKIAMDKYNAIRAKVDSVSPKGGKDAASQNPTQKRKQELIAEANNIRQKQGGAKNDRTAKMDQVKRLDEQLRSRLQEQKAARAKVSYKSVEELDDKIALLDGQVAAGTMKIVDEKKALNEISMLRKQRKNFAQIDEQQKQIDELRAKIKEIKDSMESPEQKALSERSTAIQAELDVIKAEQDEVYKNLSSLRDERSRLQAEQQQTYARIKEIKDAYYQGRKAFMAHEREQREKAAERRRLEREKSIMERRKADAERLLAEASDPAFLEEIRRAHSLLRFLDPTYQGGEGGPLRASAGLGAEPTRKVDDSEIKGMKLVRKEDRDDEFMPSTRTGKKGKKRDPAAAPSTSKFSCPPSVMADCASMGINPPMGQTEVADVIEKVKAKLAHWKESQQEQTQKNIAKAKKEIERLEREEGGGADSPAQTPNDEAAEPQPAAEKDVDVDGAAAKLDGVALEEGQEEEHAAVAAA